MLHLRDRLSGSVAWFENRALSSYWHARAPHILPALNGTTNDDVLEIGCGVGSWTSFLAPRVKKYTALEIDADALAAARQWRSPTDPIRPTASVHFVEGDAQALPFADGSFDAILMSDVIEHIPDDAQAMREVVRVLRPGGRFVLSTIRADRPSYIKRINWDHEREYGDDSLRALIETSGLTIARVFSFYRAPMMIGRELHVLVENHLPRGLWPLRLAAAFAFSPFILIERMLPVGRPAGIGIVARKGS